MKDQLNRSIIINETPKRIISLVPSQTELLVDLGLEDAIVGITKFCVHPSHLKGEKAIVGGTKQVHFDRIKALNPDIITIADSIELIMLYGALFSKEERAKTIIKEIIEKKLDFDQFIKAKPKKSVAYFIWKQPWMVAAKDNFIDELLHVNGFDNYYANLERYPEVTLNKNNQESADLVLLSTEPFPFNESHIKEMRTYFSDAKILVVDGEMFSWYGSRLLKAFDYFKSLHQDHLD